MSGRDEHLASPEDTRALGARLARVGEPGLVVHLEGQLGTGKTTLVRGLLRALGVTGPVRSPTYTLVEAYETARWRVLHLDLYRLADAEELEYLGVREEAGGEAMLLVEWPERGGAALPAADLEIALSYADGARRARLRARSPRGEGVIRRLQSLAEV